MKNIQDFQYLRDHYLDFVYYLIIKETGFKVKKQYTQLIFTLFSDQRRKDKDLAFSALTQIAKILISQNDDFEILEFILETQNYPNLIFELFQQFLFADQKKS